MVEHLALHVLGAKQPYDFNGFVDGNRAVFHATGTPDEVASFMTRVCAAIADLPDDRLEAESRILRTEASSRSFGLVDRLKWYRFGARGHGLVTMREFALEAPNAATVQAWAAAHFTAENATAWFSGPIPAPLGFEALPHGRRIPCPEPIPIAGLRTPAFLNELSGAVAISFVTDREAWISIPWQIAAERLHERLRFREGVTYSAQFEFHPIAADRGHSTIIVSCLDEHAVAVQDGLLQVLDELAQKGPSVEELQGVRRNFLRGWSEPESVPAHLDTAALNELVGYPVRALRDYAEELDRSTPDSCAAAVRAAVESAILLLPPGCPLGRDSFRPYPLWSSMMASGRRFQAASRRFPWSRKAPELVVGSDGVSIVTPEGQAVTVLYNACAGAVSHSDGALQVIGDDGFIVWIKPTEWRGGDRARDSVLRTVPSGRLLVIPAR
jgi:hypothetical protein